MKRLMTLLLSLAMGLSLCACGSDQQSREVYKIGDTVQLDLFDMTLKKADFSRALSNWCTDEYLSPINHVSGDDPYVADDGYQLLSFTFEISDYTGKEEFDFILGDPDNDNNLLSLMTKYDNDYEFAEFSIIGRKDDGEWSLKYDVDKHSYTVPSNDAFHFAPLENGAHEFRGYFQVPDELAENTEKVELVFKVCGKEVIYSISEE